MQGQGVVDLDHPKYYNGGKGILERVMAEAKDPKRYAHLKDSEGKWVVRDDVFVRYRTKAEEVKTGGLSIGFTGYGGKHHIGPELQIGHRLGDFYEEPVLLIKTAWGGKSLYKDFRPPGADGETGPFYKQMMEEIQEGLAQIKTEFPDLADHKPVITGFFWLQGWNDMGEEDARAEYADNLVQLASDVRVNLKIPSLPFVIGELGNGGPEAGESMMKIREAQKRAAELIEPKGSAFFVQTSQFARPKEESPNVSHGHHWFGNAESYFLIGDALGEAMVKLLSR